MNKNEKNKLKNQLNKEIKIMLASLLVIFVIGFGIYYFTKTNNVVAVSDKKSSDALLVREHNNRKGPDSAKVKLVEFYDPECEACSAFYPYIKQVLKDYGDKIQLVTRYALYHGNSVLAARATEAASLQGKYWEYQEMLFVNQHQWSHKQEPATVDFISYANLLGLDVKKFTKDLDDKKLMKNINLDIEDGNALGVNGTPTIYVNGEKLTNLSPNGLIEMIESKLK